MIPPAPARKYGGNAPLLGLPYFKFWGSPASSKKYILEESLKPDISSCSGCAGTDVSDDLFVVFETLVRGRER